MGHGAHPLCTVQSATGPTTISHTGYRCEVCTALASCLPVPYPWATAFERTVLCPTRRLYDSIQRAREPAYDWGCSGLIHWLTCIRYRPLSSRSSSWRARACGCCLWNRFGKAMRSCSKRDRKTESNLFRDWWNIFPRKPFVLTYALAWGRHSLPIALTFE